MNRDNINNIIKYLVIAIGSVFLLFIILSFFRIGFIFWFFEKVFEWITVRLGFDYYLSLFISLSATTLFAASLPYLAWTFLLGRKQYTTSLIVIGFAGLMCLLVYTLGTNIYFDRQTGQPLKWYADTPDGRFMSTSPGFDPKYGIRLNQYTRELALKEAQEKELKKVEERKRIEKEAKQKALKAQKEQARIKKEAQEKELKEKKEQERIEKETQEKALKEREQQALLEKESRDRESIKRDEQVMTEKEAREKALKEKEEQARIEKEAQTRREIYEREHVITGYIPLLKAQVKGIRFFEDAYDVITKNNRQYSNVFSSNEIRRIYYELDLKFPAPYRRIDFTIESVWYTPDHRIRKKNQNSHIGEYWQNSSHASGLVDAFVPGKYTVDLFVDRNRVASGSFVVLP